MKEQLIYIMNKFKKLLGEFKYVDIYNGNIYRAIHKETNSEVYIYVKHSFLNLYRKEPLSFIGTVIDAKKPETQEDNDLIDAVLDSKHCILKASSYELLYSADGKSKQVQVLKQLRDKDRAKFKAVQEQ